ncbi:A/G-specific adenine glycosylase [Methanosarcina siciliae C2J]|uniref:Adenine DNA glycosylase n=1 Tax=Methanosarcina siciliae C2J TaxID=1434118 RepID=A0A0E3PPW2_9EURY|nr:DNA glycosylase [Methanosarcina siciliae]AKB37293.1 A/G-specific adenine glycosylase [Methanosarcina siciliae C2J]
MNTVTRDKEYFSKVKIIRTELLIWEEGNLRKFPWRETSDPYKITVAEVMLHRTKADQVKDVYEQFILKYPDFESIVKAGREAIKSELYPLGLFWRADLLYNLAYIIMDSYSGKIPTNKKELLKLPGIGDYIASALLCFCFNRAEPILDTNTVRVIGRIFGLNVTDSSRRSKKFRSIMFDLINFEDPRKISLLMIDFAALVCISGDNPNCRICPLKKNCTYYSKKTD